MMVADKEYYVCKDNCWNIGQLIMIDEDATNSFFKFYDVFESKVDGVYFKEYLENFNKEISESTDISKIKNCAEQALSVIREQSMFIRELIFENVRTQEFQYQELPSRKSGIWLCTKESLPFWFDELTRRGSRRIFKVNVTGKVHHGCENYLKNDVFSHEKYRENARAYWRGENINFKREEVLFVGKMTVQGIFSDPSKVI
ncbi:MAG: DUF2441 domain-containing protein [Magnetococcales bacterium]|nr:DUF2441 domain-containing protein [Magnetococcales bacterium]